MPRAKEIYPIKVPPVGFPEGEGAGQPWRYRLVRGQKRKSTGLAAGNAGGWEFAVEATLVPEAPNGHHREVVCEGKVKVKSPRKTGGGVLMGWVRCACGRCESERLSRLG